MKVKIGIAIGEVEAASRATVPVRQLAAQAEEAEALGFDSVWLMDHFWVERDGRRSGGHEPLVSLGYIAARTRRVALGVLVLCNAFRHVGQVAREISALQDVSGGRVIAGVGAGWYDPEFDAFGLSPTHKVSRFAETLPALRALLHGERVSVDGRWLTLRDASVLTADEAPPIWVAAARERMLDLTARHADGWNLAWGGADPAWLEEPVRKLRQARQAAGLGPIMISAGIFCVPEPGAEAGPRAAVGSPPELAEVWRAYERAGVDHLVVNLSESPFVLRDRGYLERAGEALRAYRDGA